MGFCLSDQINLYSLHLLLCQRGEEGGAEKVNFIFTGQCERGAMAPASPGKTNFSMEGKFTNPVDVQTRVDVHFKQKYYRVIKVKLVLLTRHTAPF